MKASQFLGSFRGAQVENRASRLIIAGLVLVALLLAISNFSSHQTIVEVPPGLTTTGTLQKDDASAPIKEAWAMFFAKSLGDVTPLTADMTAKVMAPYLSGRIYSEVMAAISKQTEALKNQSVSTSFDPTDVFYVPAEGIVVVTGQYTVSGVDSQSISNLRTYEIGIGVRNYHITMTSLNVHKGPWQPPQAKK